MVTDHRFRPVVWRRNLGKAFAAIAVISGGLFLSNPQPEDFVDWAGGRMVTTIHKTGCPNSGDRVFGSALYSQCVDAVSKGEAYLVSFAEKQVRIRQKSTNYGFLSKYSLQIEGDRLEVIAIAGQFIEVIELE